MTKSNLKQEANTFIVGSLALLRHSPSTVVDAVKGEWLACVPLCLTDVRQEFAK